MAWIGGVVAAGEAGVGDLATDPKKVLTFLMGGDRDVRQKCGGGLLKGRENLRIGQF